MLIGRNPVRYDLCRDTVTVYHKDGETIKRTVYGSAFLEFKKNINIEKTGSQEVNSFLLVIPCGTQVVFPGDKVVRGTGPEISTREEWAAFIPAKVPQMGVVKNVDVRYWNGNIVHVEAGG